VSMHDLCELGINALGPELLEIWIFYLLFSNIVTKIIFIGRQLNFLKIDNMLLLYRP